MDCFATQVFAEGDKVELHQNVCIFHLQNVVRCAQSSSFPQEDVIVASHEQFNVSIAQLTKRVCYSEKVSTSYGSFQRFLLLLNSRTIFVVFPTEVAISKECREERTF